MKLLSVLLFAILATLLLVERADAQTGSVYLVDSSSSNFDVTPGSSFDAILLVRAIGGEPVHSISFTIPDQPYVSFSNWTPELPAGWTGSFTGTSFSVIDLTGADITDSIDVLGTFDATVALDAPIGTVIEVPAPTNVSLLDASGQQTLIIEPESYPYTGTVIAVPEPSSLQLEIMGLLICGFLAHRRLLRESATAGRGR